MNYVLLQSLTEADRLRKSIYGGRRLERPPPKIVDINGGGRLKLSPQLIEH